MKKSISIFAAFAAVLLAFSCKKDVNAPVVEGEFTSFTVELSAPAPLDVVNTKATDQQETVVENLVLLFYKSANSTPLVVPVTDLSHKAQNSTTNYVYTVTINSDDVVGDEPLTSGEWYLLAIANYNRIGFGTVNTAELRTKKLSEIESYILSRGSVGATDLLMNEGALLMTGRYGRGDGRVTLQPAAQGQNNSQTLTDRVHLRRITSKNRINFTSRPGVNFTPSSISIYNYPLQTTLFERNGWQDKTGAENNANGTFPGTIAPVINAAGKVTDITNMPFDGSYEFYMYENAQATVSACSDYQMREKREADYNTFTYAPQYGTYFVVKGTYEGPISASNAQAVKGDVTYTIHMGDFSSTTGNSGNFTVRRNSRVSYNVTVNGVNSIYVEVVPDDRQELQPGAEGNLTAMPMSNDLTVDAHFETRMVAIDKIFFDSNASIITRTPKDNNVKVDYDYGARPTTTQDVSWIKFMKPSSSTAFAAYPGDASNRLTDVYGLLADMKVEGQTYFIKRGNKYYTQAIIDEYVYDDLPLTTYVNADMRELVIVSSAKFSEDQHSSYIASGQMSIKQRSMRTMYDLSNQSASYHPFAIEVFEEQSGPLPISGINQTTNNTQKGDSMSDGYANSVTMFTTAGDSKQWGTFINTADWSLKRTSFSTEFDSDFTFRDGRMACLTRNRDANGNGIIDEEEVVWYLPARDQAVAIMLGHKALGSDYLTTEIDANPAQPHEARWYWTSSRGSAQMFNPLERQTSFSQHWAPLNNSGTESDYNQRYRFGTAAVRCARTLNSVSAVPDPVIAYDSANSTITVSNLNSVCVRGPISGEYIPHYQDEATNTMPAAFKVAANELVVGTKDQFSTNEMKTQRLCQDNYSENPDGSDLGLWRIPNQSELYSMILTMPSSVFYVAGNPGSIRRLAARTTMRLPNGVNTSIGYHWEAVFYATRNATFGVYQASGSNPLKDVGINGAYFRVRCVRDADVTGNNINAAAAGYDAGWTNAGAGSEPAGGSHF